MHLVLFLFALAVTSSVTGARSVQQRPRCPALASSPAAPDRALPRARPAAAVARAALRRQRSSSARRTSWPLQRSIAEAGSQRRGGRPNPSGGSGHSLRRQRRPLPAWAKAPAAAADEAGSPLVLRLQLPRLGRAAGRKWRRGRRRWGRGGFGGIGGG